MAIDFRFPLNPRVRVELCLNFVCQTNQVLTVRLMVLLFIDKKTFPYYRLAIKYLAIEYLTIEFRNDCKIKKYTGSHLRLFPCV